MSWSSVQIKYELIRVTEVMQSWARFKKDDSLPRITEIRDILLLSKPDNVKLLDFREELISIIVNSNDSRLIADMKYFLSYNNVSGQPDSGIPEYS